MTIYMTRNGAVDFVSPSSTYYLEDKIAKQLKCLGKAYVELPSPMQMIKISIDEDVYIEVHFNVYVELSLKTKTGFERSLSFNLFTIKRAIGAIELILQEVGVDYIFVDIYEGDKLSYKREKFLMFMGYKTCGGVNHTSGWRTKGKVMVKYLNDLLT